MRHSSSLRDGSSLGESPCPSPLKLQESEYMIALRQTEGLPTNITIRTPISDEIRNLTFNLPFRVFEESAFELPNHQNLSWPDPIPVAPTINSKQITYIDDDIEDMDLDGNLSSIEDVEMMMQQPFFDTTSWNSALTSILPKSLDEKDAPGFPVMPPFLRRLFFSVANNFAGLDAFPTRDVIPYLQKVGDAKHYQLIHSAQGYSSRMIIQNIFKAAIEAGNANIVDLLLRQRPATIDVNKRVLCVNGSKYTPIERATELQHVHVVESLLEHGAHLTEPSEHSFPDNTFESCRGILDFWVQVRERRFRRGSFVIHDHHRRIFKRLFKAGSNLTQRSLSRLIELREGELAVMVVSAKAPESTATWCQSGLLRDAITFLDDESSMAIINIMLKNGADLDYDAKLKRNPWYRRTKFPDRGGRIIFPADGGRTMVRTVDRAIEAAALTGKLEISRLLLESGVQMTDNTLPFAVTSGNEDLIAMLLDRGANANSIGSFKFPPLAAAIRTQNARVISMLEARGASILMHNRDYCRAILQAATEAGNVPVIERLIQFECRLDPFDLGTALNIAVQNEQDEIAKILIDSGANVNFGLEGMHSPLNQGIKKRKQNLVTLLLDAGMNPDAPNRTSYPPLIHAVERGLTSVIKALILAGADVNAQGDDGDHDGASRFALTAAVKQQDLALVQLLLEAGADINNSKFGGSALSAAVGKGDFKMAHYLIGHGADPHDSLAVEMAMTQKRNLLDLLLQSHTSRYRKGRPGFGSSALVHVIKRGDESSIRMMLANGIDIHSMTYGGTRHIHTMMDRAYSVGLVTPFWHAIKEKRHSIIDLLLASGCNPEEIVCQSIRLEIDGSSLPRTTAFVTAIDTLDIPIIKLFIRHKADVNFPARGRVTRTPLQKAAELGDLSILELLLDHGADVHAPAAYNGGATALQLAAIGGYFPVVCKLLALKADANAPPAKVNGRFALEGATEHGRLDMVQLLLNAGAGTGESGKRQVENAIELADENGHFPICDLLRDHFHLGG